MPEPANALPEELPDELRDGLLQDLVAVGLVMTMASRSLPASDGNHALRAALASATTTLDADLRAVRSLIDRLRRAA